MGQLRSLTCLDVSHNKDIKYLPEENGRPGTFICGEGCAVPELCMYAHSRGGMEPGGRGVGRGTWEKGCRGGMEPGGRGVGRGDQGEGV